MLVVTVATFTTAASPSPQPGVDSFSGRATSIPIYLAYPVILATFGDEGLDACHPVRPGTEHSPVTLTLLYGLWAPLAWIRLDPWADQGDAAHSLPLFPLHGIDRHPLALKTVRTAPAYSGCGNCSHPFT